MADTNEQILFELKELKSWLYGKNGFEGDIPEIKENCMSLKRDQNHLKEKYEKLSRNFWVLVASLVGSGILGAGLLQVFN